MLFRSTLDLPTGEANFMVQPVDLASLMALAERAEYGQLPPDSSASVRWFAAITLVASKLVERGRVTPHVAHRHGHLWEAEWQPLPSDLDHCRALLRSMPPVVRAAGHADPEHIMQSLIDSITRLSLMAKSYRGTFHEGRTVNGRSVRAVGQALIGPDPTFAVTDEDRKSTRLNSSH